MKTARTRLPFGSASFSALRQGLADYFARLTMFRRNARLYMVNAIVSGIAQGVYYLLFNFYLLSLGYDEVLVGRLYTTSSMASLVGALPMGFLSDRLGRKAGLLGGTLMMGLAMFGMVAWTSQPALYLLNLLYGLGLSLFGVTMGPFLMANSGEEERTYLFSFSAGIGMTAGFFGNYLGGHLPGWFGRQLGLAPATAGVYASSMLVAGAVMVIGALPLLLIARTHNRHSPARSPFGYLRRQPRLIARLLTPGLVISLGAGLVMPFINLFYRSVHQQPDATIGSLFAWGSLAMALGLLIAPPLADRLGKIKVVIISQSLSIPFLVMLGFSPWFWLSAAGYLVRLGLMNMSWPIFDAYIMERVEESSRGFVASLASMSFSVGWSFSPLISGVIQVRYGFAPLFLGTIGAYLISIFLYWQFFWRNPIAKVPSSSAEQA